MKLIMKQALKVMLLAVLASGLLVSGCSTPVEAPKIGKPAPSFELTDISGKPVSLSDFQGKPVVLNFWATWCAPCRFEMPYIQEVHDRWAEHGLIMLTVNIGESRSRVETFLQNNNLSLPVLLDLDAEVAERYNIQGIPTTYFIDGKGIIRDRQIGAFRSVAEIEDKLSTIPPNP